MKNGFTVIKAAPGDAAETARLMLLLWPDNSPAGLRDEADDILAGADGAVFLLRDAQAPEGIYAGFAHCSLRHEYVEGTVSEPVGYLEGI